MTPLAIWQEMIIYVLLYLLSNTISALPIFFAVLAEMNSYYSFQNAKKNLHILKWNESIKHFLLLIRNTLFPSAMVSFMQNKEVPPLLMKYYLSLIKKCMTAKNFIKNHENNEKYALRNSHIHRQSPYMSMNAPTWLIVFV